MVSRVVVVESDLFAIATLYGSGLLEAGGGNCLHRETCGSAKGIATLVIHGRPWL